MADNFLTKKSVLGLVDRVQQCPPPIIIGISENMTYCWAKKVSPDVVINKEYLKKQYDEPIMCLAIFNGFYYPGFLKTFSFKTPLTTIFRGSFINITGANADGIETYGIIIRYWYQKSPTGPFNAGDFDISFASSKNI